MRLLSTLCCVGYLCYLSVLDIKTQRLPDRLLAAGVVVALLQLFLGISPSIILSLAGAAVGMAFLGISKVTGEAFGYGDSIVILILGLSLGLWNLLALLMLSFLLAAGCSTVLLAKFNFQRKTTFPFIPFLVASYVLVLIFGGF
ncbi:MAG: hypothetical protein HFH15_10740 [Ruminococcus sp.]|nr:hypothetical protein [Ruminococcus sp.]